MEPEARLQPRGGVCSCPRCGRPGEEEVRRDVDAIFWSLRLHGVRRFFRQRFWESESAAAECAGHCEGWPRLESVSEHSWHVADMALLLATHFRHLNLLRCLEMAILHDKLEIITGDADPVGTDGTGTQTHAFNPARRAEKDMEASRALEQYLSLLRDDAAQLQRGLFQDIISGTSPEAVFVRAVDKLQAFAFVITKKRGNFQDGHLAFTLQYVEKGVSAFPGLWGHYLEMRGRLVAEVARVREKPVDAIERWLRTPPAVEQQQQWTRSET